MLSLGEHTLESCAFILNTDKTILKLNHTIEKFGYQFLWIDATEFEKNYSEIFNVPKDDSRPLSITIGSDGHGISHELHHALVHSQILGPLFLHMEYPGIILLKKLSNFKVTGLESDYLIESKKLSIFSDFVQNLLLQLRLYKIGEIRCSQLFHISTKTRQVSMRQREIEIGSYGNYTLTDEEAKKLSNKLTAKYETNALTELAVKNFSVVYDLPDGRIRFITLMTCLESLFNLGKDQIAHTISRHLALIISEDKEQFQENYKQIKKLYNKRNSIVHGGEHKGDIMEDYLDLSDKVRAAINFCNTPEKTKDNLFQDLNSRGF